MKEKFILDLTVAAAEHIHERYVLLRLRSEAELPEMQPGQFVEVRVDDSPHTMLRRPISINFVDRERGELWLLVATVGEGTRRLGRLKAGDRLNCVLPLGRGFARASEAGGRFLLVGGGVGVAPLLYQGCRLKAEGAQVTFLLGARTGRDVLLLSEFERYGRVLVTTEDGSLGEKGFVTQHSVLARERWDMIQCCGPTPMMKAVAAYAWQSRTDCQVSLENLMACGLGACLCCVEKIRRREADGSETVDNVCVCKEGPVFYKEQLTWQI